MADTLNTKPFYNTTIPSDWEIKKLSDCCKIKGEYGINAAAVEYSDNLPTYLRITDIDDDGNYSSIKKASVNGENVENFVLRNGDIVFARTGATVGKSYLYKENDGKLVFAGFLIRFRPNDEILDVQHLNFFTDTNIYWNWVKTISMRSGQPGINALEYGSLKIPLPPLPEQNAIANVLSLMDTTINKNNQLIAQKELRKKWLMQNLLTGKKRLNGFSGEWKEMKLGKLFTEIKSVNDGADSHSIMTISSKLGLISQEDKFDRVIAGDSLKKYTQLKKDDFAYNKGNSKTYPMGCIYQLEEYESALVPFVYICFSPTSLVDAKFYKQWFLAYGLDRQLKKIITSGARGDGLLNVNKTDFFNLKTIYPPKVEQTAISQVLQAADKEIALLKAKTEKLREQKKGMMQVLLTGKKRLKIN
jgi:type I restriction enzyme S subunit